MVRMGRGETMSPGVLPWHMDAVAERYAQQDGQTLQAAGHLLAPICLLLTAGAAAITPAATAAAAVAGVMAVCLLYAVLMLYRIAEMSINCMFRMHQLTYLFQLTFAQNAPLTVELDV